MSTRGVSPEIVRHSCEGRNPENAVPSELDARLRGLDIKNTPTPGVDKIYHGCRCHTFSSCKTKAIVNEEIYDTNQRPQPA
jgi:hypothetical protein